MGNNAEYLLGNKPVPQQFVSVGSAVVVNGIKGKVVKRIGDPDNRSVLPFYSGTSDVYFRKNENGICQARVYLERKMMIDFDWGHSHTNKSDKQSFKSGVVHVQTWQWRSDGSFKRQPDARLMTGEEIRKYGKLILHFAPDAKFR